MNNTEIFKLCENSSTKQCRDCNTYWEFGIVFCSCGRNSKSSQRTKELDKNNYDVSSIPGYVIKKNSSRGAKYGSSEQQRMYYKAKEMLLKDLQEKKGTDAIHPYFARWNNDYKYRKSSSDIGWTEEHIMLHDIIALENHSYVATQAERIRNSTHWILTLNKEGAQQP